MLFEPLAIPRVRFGLLAGLFVLGTSVLLVRLWNVQVSQGGTYTSLQHNQTTVAVRLSPARGAIVDRNGVALAENRASFDIDFYLDELVRNYSREHRGHLPRIDVERKTARGTATTKQVDIYKIVTTYLEPISHSLGFNIKLDENALRQHYNQSPTIPFQYRSDVDFATLAQFSERNLGVPGIQIAVRPVRYYPYGAMAAHLLGSVGLNDTQRQAADGHELETIGRSGLESVFDGQLQGKPGGRILHINYRGYIVDDPASADRAEGYFPPTVGNSVYLTIDARIQAIVEQALRRQGRAAAVVLDPNNGDILAMASVPSFDPNDFIPRITNEKWKALNGDATDPLTNRAVSTYVPGSTFKVVVTLAGFHSGKFTPDTEFNCPSELWIGNRYFHNDDSIDRGNISLHEALRNSVNTFYYQLGIRIGIGAIDEEAGLLGLGQPTGYPLPEDPGIIPGPEWLKAHYPRERWSEAYTANVSIGQGAVQVSPLQMATVMAAVANGGTVYYPRLVIGVSDLDGHPQVSVPTRVRDKLNVKPAQLAALREALLAVVESGTGVPAKLPYVHIAGKTGTATAFRILNGTKVRDIRAWLYAYAPYEKPRYVVCVMAEGGTWGGSTSGPIVKDIFDGIFQMEKTGKSPQLAYLPPAVGNFHGVTDWTREAAPTPAAADDDDR
jgi:penicillin-binding protein 2